MLESEINESVNYNAHTNSFNENANLMSTVNHTFVFAKNEIGFVVHSVDSVGISTCL